MPVRRRASSYRPAEVIEISPERPAPARIRRVAHWIRSGAVVAIPTDTVYGLAADPFNEQAVAEIFRVKRRAETLPILLLLDSAARVDELASALPSSFARLARRFWPGPLTIVLPASLRVPETVTAGTGSIAVRLPASPLVRALARAVGGPLTGTSANVSGRPACLSASQINRQLGTSVPYIVNGGVSRARRPSTIVDLTGEPRVLREGAIGGRLVMESL